MLSFPEGIDGAGFLLPNTFECFYVIFRWVCHLSWLQESWHHFVKRESSLLSQMREGNNWLSSCLFIMVVDKELRQNLRDNKILNKKKVSRCWFGKKIVQLWLLPLIGIQIYLWPNPLKLRLKMMRCPLPDFQTS